MVGLPLDWSPRERGIRCSGPSSTPSKSRTFGRRSSSRCSSSPCSGFGSHLPAPDIDFNKLEQQFNQASNGGQSVLQFIDLFSGGALTRFAVFSLGIMPYITSSIIMQLLTVVIPRLEQWQRQGEVGIKKITQWTRYMTVTLALLQSTGLVFLFNNQFQVGEDVRRRSTSRSSCSR